MVVPYSILSQATYSILGLFVRYTTNPITKYTYEYTLYSSYLVVLNASVYLAVSLIDTVPMIYLLHFGSQHLNIVIFGKTFYLYHQYTTYYIDSAIFFDTTKLIVLTVNFIYNINTYLLICQSICLCLPPHTPKY